VTVIRVTINSDDVWAVHCDLALSAVAALIELENLVFPRIFFWPVHVLSHEVR
jgi:hypothetical protein